RPTELAVLQPLGNKAHAGPVPEDQLHPVCAFGTEDIDGAAERVGPHLFPPQRCQPFRTLAEVDRLRRDQDADSARRPDHEQPFRARITAAMVCVSAPLPMRSTAPSISSSIGAGGLVGRRFGRDGCSTAVASVTAGSITAGTNDGTASSIDATRLRACLRQVKTCCGRRPCRRATSDTIAPGTSVSATILALSSSVQSRRPPAPLITSKR